MMRRCLLAASTTIAAGRSNAAASASSRLWTSSWLSPSSSSSAFGVQVTSAINYRFFSSSSSSSSVERSTSEREKERERRASPPPVDYEDEDYEDGYAPPYPAEDLVPGPRMLKLIVTELEKQGLTFILPVCDEDSMTALAEPLRRLVNIGVQPTFVVDACVKRPDLFRALTRNGEKAWAALELLVENCEITYEDAIRIFASYGEELLATTAEEIQARVDVLNSCGFGSGKEVGRVIRTCPALLFASDAEHMIGIVDAMHSFFSRKELTTVVRLAPQVLLRSIEEVEEKWEYIFYKMYLESTAFVDCSTWSDKSLEEIATRHEFLLRTGAFTQPDPKKPQIEKENPNLHAILDSDSVNFATQVAGVTTEEWMVFQALRDKGDPDFEKVKPSMRKRLERERKKQREDLDDNVFDTSIDRAGRH